MDLTTFNKISGVIYLTENNFLFSDRYTAARKKEQRILNNEQVASLPYISNIPNADEWKVRQKSMKRFIKYLSEEKKPLIILDIGCGNGWFTNKMAEISNKNRIIGLDINKEELEQAATVFTNKNIMFCFGDIFKIEGFENYFDRIILNASIQYFENFNLLFSKLKSFLKPKGEIHIIDSPFYKNKEIPNAKKRTFEYYTKLGFPQMAKHYFHHSLDDVKEFKKKYRPKNRILSKMLQINDSPFPWLYYKK